VANVIEIRIRATDETAPVYDKTKLEAAAAGRDSGAAYTSGFASHVRGEGGSDMSQSLAASLAGAMGSKTGADLGDEIGDQITDSISDTVGRELGEKVEDPIKRSGSTSGTAFSSAFQGQLGQGLASSGLAGMAQQEGERFTASFSKGAKSGMEDANLAGIVGDAFGDIEDAIPPDTLGPDSPAGQKIRENAKKTGQEAGKDAGEGMSPVMVTALAAGLSVGGPLILGAFSGIMVGVAALALKNNAVIAKDFSNLGSAAENAFTEAAAPLAGTMHQALMGLETDVSGLEPQLKGLFANAEPDITAVTSGIGAFASNILPGMSSALKDSQVIVSDLGQSLGGLGAGVGGMFQGLTRDAYTTGAGLQSLLGTVGHLASTLGGVLGSAASVGSTALMGLDPILNTTLSLVQRLANPATVGAMAGLFAAMKLGGETGAITSGLSSAAGKLSTFAEGAVDAEGEVSGLGRAAGGLSGVLKSGASVMSGPWGMAIGAGIGLATGLAGAIINASHASDALTLSQQGLDQAVSQDNGHIGQATAAYVAAQAQSDGLAKSAAAAGVSLQTWTQAVIGNKAAQLDVVMSVQNLNQLTENQATATADAATQTGKYSGELQDAHSTVIGQAAATDRLTAANQQVLTSMTAQNQQITQAVQKQANLTEATNILANATDIFGASLNEAYQQLVSTAQQSALTSVASMNLGASSVDLSQKLAATETAYTEATSAAQGYSTILTALNGTTMSVDQAQNTLAQQMNSAKTSFVQNKESLDLSTAAGVANRQALVSAATAIQALGDAEYQKTGSINDANKAMRDQEQAFVDATGAVGKQKTAIEQYIDSLLKIPTSETTTITQVYTSKTSGQVEMKGGGGDKAEATGGAYGGAAATGGVRSNLVMVGEHGTELVRMPFGSTVIPASNVQSMAASGAMSGPGGRATIELEFSGADQEFLTFIRKVIRVRAGSGSNSVQTVLGYGS
jgi:hypothetical protein